MAEIPGSVIAGGVLAPPELDVEPQSETDVPPGWFRMWVAGHPLGGDDDEYPVIRCLLGRTAPLPIRGYGGWVSQRRQGRRGRARFEGPDTLAFSISLLLENDVVKSKDGTPGKWRRLERLCGMERHDDTPPPVVKWQANAPQHDYSRATQNRWVCESLEWGDSNSSDYGKLLWIEATLVLGLYDVDALQVSAASGFKRRTLEVGQTLRDFARQWLGDPKRWRDVADLNRDNPQCPTTPDHKATKPVELAVPPQEDVDPREARQAAGQVGRVAGRAGG